MIRQRKPLRRKTPLRRVSKKRAKDMRVYSERRRKFLKAHPVCQVWCVENGYREENDGFYVDSDGYTIYAADCIGPKSTEVHHREKRGKNYLNESTWMAVSKLAHERIHRNPKEARAKGWLL